MPNILLKDELGVDIEYENIDTLTVRTSGGGTATYTWGNPTATDAWNMVETIRRGASQDIAGYTKYSWTCGDVNIVSYAETGFGTWVQTRNDAWRISDTCFTSGYVAGDVVFLSLNVNDSALYLWDNDTQALTVADSSSG